MTELDKDKLQSRQEIVIPITLRGLWKGLEKIVLEFPTNSYTKGARALDSFSQKMMTGHLAVITMPLGIMLRNGSRVAHVAADRGGEGFWSRASVGTLSFVGGLAGWFAAGQALFGAATTSLAVTGTIGKIGAFIGAAVLSTPAILPGVALGVLGGATALAAIATTLSVIPAIVNLPRALNRSIDRFKGVKYDVKVLEEAQREIEENSLSRKYDRRLYNVTLNNIQELPKKDRQSIYKTLAAEFGDAADKKNVADDAAPTAPSLKKGGGPQETM